MSNGKSLTFANLFKDLNRVVIPIIQRDFAQGRSSAEDVRVQFLQAIFNILIQPPEDVDQPLDLDFIYGSFESDSPDVFSVLDGQQRLTTLFLLHWYLAAKEERANEFRNLIMLGRESRFNYQTRPSSSEFFNALVVTDFEIPSDSDQINALSSKIVDCHWFFLSWKRDPTVQSCLVVLDTIHNLFKNSEKVYDRLLGTENPYITFQFLNLEEFGLSDELYIKMNARGKPLTPFENFKAWLFGHVEKYSAAKEFELNVDQNWTDIFWQLSNGGENDFDQLFLRYFYISALYEACETSDDSYYLIDSELRTWLNALRNADGYLPISKFEQYESFKEQSIIGLSKFLEFYRLHRAHAESDLFKSILSGVELIPLIRFYAVYVFVSKDSDISDWGELKAKQLRRWMRVINNLINNSRIDDMSTFFNALKSIHRLSQYSQSIYESLIDLKSNEITFFSSDQCNEEVLKARLILEDGDWEDTLIEFEGHEYFMGQVGFLLRYATIDDEDYEINMFRKYATKAAFLLKQDVLNSKDFVLQRALLTIDDYLVQVSYNRYTFCIPNNASFRERNENWLRVVKKPVFKTLLDSIGENILDSLSQLIQRVSCGGWRQLLVNFPQAISYCGSDKFVQIDSNTVYLLSKSRLSGYHAELRTYALYLQLLAIKNNNNLPKFIKSSFSYLAVYGDDTPELRLEISDSDELFISYDNGYVAYKFDETEDDYVEVEMPKVLTTYIADILGT